MRTSASLCVVWWILGHPFWHLRKRQLMACHELSSNDSSFDITLFKSWEVHLWIVTEVSLGPKPRQSSFLQTFLSNFPAFWSFFLSYIFWFSLDAVTCLPTHLLYATSFSESAHYLSYGFQLSLICKSCFPGAHQPRRPGYFPHGCHCGGCPPLP